MERTRFIEHKGKPILLLDYSDLRDPATILQEIENSKRIIAALPQRKELRTLTNVIGSMYNTEVLNALKELAAHNRPWVAAAAVVTTSGLHRIGILAVATFSRRKLQAFGDLAHAKEWLADQRAESAA
jgi:hypothetical protein